MKITKLFFAALAVLAFGACQNNGEEFVKPVKANIVGNIGDKALATRAYNATWEKDDAIGLFVSGLNTTINNANFTTDGVVSDNYVTFTSTTTSIEYPSNGSDLTFNAYYPHGNITSDGAARYYNVTNWSGQDKITADKFDPFDLMVADQVSHNSLNPNVKLTFRHKFSKLILMVDANVVGTQLKEGDLIDMEVKATGMNYPVKCDVITGDVTTTSKNSVGDFLFKTVTNGKQYEAIICPDEFPIATSKIVFTLKKKTGETTAKTFTWTPTMPTGSETTTFASGNSYVWYLRLNGKSVEAELKATIVNWTENTFYTQTNPLDIQQDK